MNVGEAKLLDAGDLVVVEAKDLEVGEVLQAGAVEVGQVVVGDVQGSEGGREGCQELMDSCQVRVRMQLQCIQDKRAKVSVFLEESPGREFLR